MKQKCHDLKQKLQDFFLGTNFSIFLLTVIFFTYPIVYVVREFSKFLDTDPNSLSESNHWVFFIVFFAAFLFGMRISTKVKRYTLFLLLTTFFMLTYFMLRTFDQGTLNPQSALLLAKFGMYVNLLLILTLVFISIYSVLYTRSIGGEWQDKSNNVHRVT